MDADFEEEISKLTSEMHEDYIDETNGRPTSAPPSTYDITSNLFAFHHQSFPEDTFESEPHFGFAEKQNSQPVDARKRTQSIENFLAQSPGSILAPRKRFGSISKQTSGDDLNPTEGGMKGLKNRLDALNLSTTSDDNLNRFLGAGYKLEDHSEYSSFNETTQDYSKSANAAYNSLPVEHHSNIEPAQQQPNVYQYQTNPYGYYPQQQQQQGYPYSYQPQHGYTQQPMVVNQWSNAPPPPRGQPPKATDKSKRKGGSNKQSKGPQHSTSRNEATAAVNVGPVIAPEVPLEECKGKIFQLSQEQNGCRYLQQKVEADGSSACEMILAEVQSRLSTLMMDPFGNYLFQKLVEKATADQRQIMLELVRSNMIAAALNLHGTRSVQKFIEVCGGKFPTEHQLYLVIAQLEPFVTKMSMDTNGNHVIQRCLQYIPSAKVGFVYDAVIRDVMIITRHRHGCCVFQRCIDAANPTRRRALIDRVVENAIDLMQDPFGNYVVQYVLEQARPGEASRLIQQLPGKLTQLSRQKFSSNVVEKCLQHATHTELEPLIVELCESDVTRTLLNDQFANYVVQRALHVADDDQGMRLVQAIRPHMTNLHAVNASCARRVSSRVIKRFPQLATDKLFSAYFQKETKY